MCASIHAMYSSIVRADFSHRSHVKTFGSHLCCKKVSKGIVVLQSRQSIERSLPVMLCSANRFRAGAVMFSRHCGQRLWVMSIRLSLQGPQNVWPSLHCQMGGVITSSWHTGQAHSDFIDEADGPPRVAEGTSSSAGASSSARALLFFGGGGLTVGGRRPADEDAAANSSLRIRASSHV